MLLVVTFMRKIFFIIVLLFFTIKNVFSQDKTFFNGKILDVQTNEFIIGATIQEVKHDLITESNNYGYFNLEVGNEDTVLLLIRHVGYKPLTIKVAVTSKLHIFNLYSEVRELQEVKVKYSLQKAFSSINPIKIKESPVIFGEPDVIKVMQLMPGVVNTADGSSGLFIKGGKNDQNLFLLDDAPIYNIAHLFGLVSVYNSDIIKDFKVYDVYMPPGYGGRASAVLDSRMKDGNKKSFALSGGISTLMSRFMVEGPINKEKSSFILSARRSTIDLLVKPSENNNTVPAFADINLKLNHQINNKSAIYYSLFYSFDDLLSFESYSNKWTNLTNTLRYHNLLTNKISLNTILVYSDYNNNIDIFATSQEQQLGLNWNTGVRDLKLKQDFTYFINQNNTIDAGLEIINHEFAIGNSDSVKISIPGQTALEYAVYINHDCKLSNTVNLNYGLRYSGFANYGSSVWYTYQDNIPVKENIEGNGIWNSYTYLEPRFLAQIKFNRKNSLNMTYSRNVQYMQVLSNNVLPYTNLESWLPVSRNISPVVADIFSISYLKEFESIFEAFKMTAYYKKINNQIDFVDNARLVGNRFIESEIRAGQANAYGVETSISGETNKISYGLSYVYSKVRNTIEGINNSNPYNASHDIPHNIKTDLLFRFNEKMKLSVFWTFSTGRPANIPIAYYRGPDLFKPGVSGINVPIFGERNNQRFPNYHRMDIAFTYQLKNIKEFEHQISIGAYNVYANKNPLEYQYFFLGLNDVRAITFFSIIPNINYTFNIR